MRKRYQNNLFGLLSAFFAFLILAYPSLSGKVNCAIQPLIPALQSNWLISHVISSFLAYACFAIAFGTSVLYLLKIKMKPSMLPDAPFLDEVTYKMISIGFVLLTLGIITGAAWADRAWGTVLGMGSEGNMVAHYVADLWCFSSCTPCQGVERRQDVPGLNNRFYCRYFHLSRG